MSDAEMIKAYQKKYGIAWLQDNSGSAPPESIKQTAWRDGWKSAIDHSMDCCDKVRDKHAVTFFVSEEEEAAEECRISIEQLKD